MPAITETRRDSLLEAMVRVVGRKGYEATSVADVIEEAGTSRTTFYKHFDDKHDCFLSAYDMLVERVFDTIVAECDGEQPWLSRVRKGLATLIGIFAREPELARTAVVEVAVAGAEARQRHWDAVARFTGYLEDGEGLDPGGELPQAHLGDGDRRRLRPDLRRAGGGADGEPSLPDARPALRDARSLHRPGGGDGRDAARCSSHLTAPAHP